MAVTHKARLRDAGPWMLLAFCVSLMLALALPLPTLAAQGDRVVRVGYYENEVFEEGAQPDTVKTGYAYEYYRKLSEYTGWEYEYVYGSFGDLYQMLCDGDIDLLAGLAWKEDRAAIIGYPDAAMGNESYSLVKHETDESITVDPTSLNGKRIGVLESAMSDALVKYLEEHHIDAEVKTYPDYDVLFDEFDKGELDVLAAEGDGAYARDNAEVLFAYGASDYYLCVNVKRPDLLSELNIAQSSLATEEPNYLNSLRAKYYPVSVTARAFSTAEKGWIKTHDSLHVGYLNNYLPYSDTDDDGRVTGFVKDVVSEIFNGLGISSKLAITYTGYDSYDDMIAAMSSGDIDVAFPVGGGLYYSEENGIYQSNAVASAATELVFKGEFSEETTARFAVNEKNRMQYYYIRTNYPNAEIAFYPSIDDCLAAVLSGEASCTTLNGLRANDILKNSEYEGLSLQQTNRSDDRCFGVKIGNEGLLKLLNRGLNIVGSDYAQNLSYRYVGGLYSYDFFDMVHDHMAIFGLGLAAIASLIIVFLVRETRHRQQEIIEKETARQVLEEKNRELAESREALAEALETAEHANRAKTTFLNNMSHDIRTPMNAIVGFTTLAISHIDDTGQVREYLDMISVSSQHLLALINDVLDMSRIESGKMTINMSDVHLPDVIHDLKTIIQPNMTAKQLGLFIDTQDVVHEDIVTDKLRLNQVLLNILSNAIKFTPNGGSVRFRVIEKPSSTPDVADFEFRVEDNGIGMSEEFQKTIFEPFTREKSSTVSGIQGTGLGMAITKSIIDMMGGTITVNSQEGVGSEFVVNLSCRISDTSAELGRIAELSGLRALVVDDDTNTCLSICGMLSDIGLRPDWTTYGKEAAVRAKEALDQADEYSVYLIDWMMPDQDGIETARCVRNLIGDRAPIIALTAYDFADVEDEAKEAGVTTFCTKPLFMSELRSVLARSFLEAETPAEGAAKRDFSGKRILLVEDNEMNQMIATMILQEHGFTVDVASDGLEAIEKMETAPAGYYEVILMDIQMPQMDGYEATRRIRAFEDPRKARIPIVAVTANAFEEDVSMSKEMGMNGHLAKPYDVSAIMATLDNLIP